MSSKMKAVKSLPFWLDNKIQKWYPIFFKLPRHSEARLL